MTSLRILIGWRANGSDGWRVDCESARGDDVSSYCVVSPG
jgi:hypothetical protein